MNPPNNSTQVLESWAYALGQKWTALGQAVLDPFFLISFLSSLVLGLFSVQIKDTGVNALLTILLALSSGVAGARLTNEWQALTEGKAIEHKGRTAIRGLKLLFNSISMIQERTRYYIAHIKETPGSSATITAGLEEIVEKSKLVQRQALNSIEDWNDILPEADIGTMVDELSALENKYEDQLKLTSELQERQEHQLTELEQLRQVASDKDATSAEMIAKIEALEQQLSTTSKALSAEKKTKQDLQKKLEESGRRLGLTTPSLSVSQPAYNVYQGGNSFNAVAPGRALKLIDSGDVTLVSTDILRQFSSNWAGEGKPTLVVGSQKFTPGA